MFQLKMLWSKLPSGECGSYALERVESLSEADELAQAHLKALPGAGAVDHVKYYQTLRAASAWYTRIGEDDYTVRIYREA